MPAQYFLLSIAINSYMSTTIRKLEGCLKDSESIQCCLKSILGPRDPSAIRVLRNGEATRAAIISAFFEHLIENVNIKIGNPIIIHYSGHGGRAIAPERWLIGSHTIETLCPADQSTVDVNGGLIPGIPDVTVNALLRILARHKGNNITFICDTCHSGGIDRGIGADSEPLVARYNPNNPPLPPYVDHDILARANCEGKMFPFHGSYKSHVLLAACTEEEMAYERPDRSGAFTTALTSRLHALGSGLERVTYSELMEALPIEPKRLSEHQHPQCEGHFGNCFLFAERNQRAPWVFSLEPDSEGFRVSVGQAHGLSVGTEMDVYRDASAVESLGVLVVWKVYPVSAACRPRDITFDVPMNSWAGIRTWNGGDLHIFADFSVPHSPSNFQSQYRLHQATEKMSGRISLSSASPGKITVEREDPLINEIARRSADFLAESSVSLSHALQKVAHFYFHLGRQKSPAKARLDYDALSVADRISLHMTPFTKDSDGFCVPGAQISPKDNIFVVKPREYHTLTIKSDYPVGLYPYLFYFDPADYSIEAVYLAPSTAINPPLAAKSEITIGPNHGHWLKFTDAPTGGIFKLIVCTRKIDLAHIAQGPPFQKSSTSVATNSDNTRHLELHTTGPSSPEFWATSSVAVVVA
ncbi:caspase domain-containing protein [Mycena alexandri]|uniref:Caspase domain-containing protein n=1 Tax=Mycena alexandri TaxID=1745969 RepID=A0AAD6SX84_9AGAR|nr:caspase domain-containing protein [Mycena alexandri]